MATKKLKFEGQRIGFGTPTPQADCHIVLHIEGKILDIRINVLDDDALDESGSVVVKVWNPVITTTTRESDEATGGSSTIAGGVENSKGD